MTQTFSASLHGCRIICAGSTSRSGSGFDREPMKILPGQKFGMLTAVEHIGYYRHPVAGNAPIWRWRCDCGGTKDALVKNVKAGITKSCGCLAAKALDQLHASNRKHGDCPRSGEHPLYSIWKGMKKRCENPDSESFCYYGARGIKVLWDCYQAFKRDMEPSYKPGLQIDRIDNSGNYCKSNCRWATAIQQANNKSTNRMVNFAGKTLSIADWARETGIPYSTLRDRLNRGWGMAQILVDLSKDWIKNNEHLRP